MARPSRTNFSQNFANLLETLGVSQVEFAKTIGRTQNSVSRWLNGASEPGFEDKDAIIAAARKHGVNITVADLYVDPTDAQDPALQLKDSQKRRRDIEKSYNKIGEALDIKKKRDD